MRSPKSRWRRRLTGGRRLGLRRADEHTDTRRTSYTRHRSHTVVPANGVPLTGKSEYFAHESAFIDADVVIGAGTTIWHVSHIMEGARIGKDCRIGQNVVIGRGVTVGEGVKIQ